MTYGERAEQHRRLLVLQHLGRQNDGRANERDILEDLDSYGHRLSRDQVRAVLGWLSEAGAVRLTRPGEVVVVAEITARGQDHVDRRGDPIEGVALPGRA